MQDTPDNLRRIVDSLNTSPIVRLMTLIGSVAVMVAVPSWKCAVAVTKATDSIDALVVEIRDLKQEVKENTEYRYRSQGLQQKQWPSTE